MGEKEAILIEIQRRKTLNPSPNQFTYPPPPTTPSQNPTRNHDEHNILLATPECTKSTSTLMAINRMFIPIMSGVVGSFKFFLKCE